MEPAVEQNLAEVKSDMADYQDIDHGSIEACQELRPDEEANLHEFLKKVQVAC